MGNGGSRGRARTQSGGAIDSIPHGPPTHSSRNATTYASEAQHAEVQRLARLHAGDAGETAYGVGRDGQIISSISGLTGAREVHITQEQYAALRLARGTLFHNHPVTDPHSLSDEDVAVAMIHRMAGSDVAARLPSGRTVIYSIRPGTQEWSARTWQSIERDVQTARTITRAYVDHMEQSGALTRARADATYWHRVWSIVAAQHPEALTYTWEVLPR